MTSSYEEYRKGYEVGYFWGRMDALNGKDYDARTVSERKDIADGTVETGM